MESETRVPGGDVPLESKECESSTMNQDPDDLKIQEFATRLGCARPSLARQKKRPSVPRTVSLDTRISSTEQRRTPRRSSSSYEVLVRQKDMFRSFVSDARRDFQPALPKRYSASTSPSAMSSESTKKRASIVSALTIPSDLRASFSECDGMDEKNALAGEEQLRRISLISALTTPTDSLPACSEDTVESEEVDESSIVSSDQPPQRTSILSVLTTPADQEASSTGGNCQTDNDLSSVSSGFTSPAFKGNEDIPVAERRPGRVTFEARSGVTRKRGNQNECSSEPQSLSKLDLHQSALAKLARKFRQGVPVGAHKYHFKKYENTFVGSEAIDFMVNSGMVETREDAVFLAQRFVNELGLFHHVCWDHTFLKDDHLFYRFTDEGRTGGHTAMETPETSLESLNQPSIQQNVREKTTASLSTSNSGKALGQDLQVAAETFQKHVPVSSHTYHFVKYKKSFVGSEAVDKMVDVGLAKTRMEAVFLGQRLQDECSLFSHVKFQHPFKDEYLFYCYTTEKKEPSAESSRIPFQAPSLTGARGNSRWSLRASFVNQRPSLSQSSHLPSTPQYQPRGASKSSLRSSLSSQQSSYSQTSPPQHQQPRRTKSSLWPSCPSQQSSLPQGSPPQIPPRTVLRSSLPSQMSSHADAGPVQRPPPLVRGWSEPEIGHSAPQLPRRHGSIVASMENAPLLPAMAEGEAIRHRGNNSRFGGVDSSMGAPALPVRNMSIVSGMPTSNAAQHLQDVDVASQDTDGDFTAESSSYRGGVSFGKLQIRVYDRCLDLNPATSSGPSIGLGWSYRDLDPLHLSDEKKRLGNGRFRLSRSEREDILEDCGYTRKEIARAVRQISKAREKRKDTLNRLSARSMGRR